MAWPNSVQRREAVKKKLNNYTTSDLKEIAKEFGCSYTAVWNDVIALKYGEGTYPSSKLRKAIRERDNYICQYCGKYDLKCIVDHVVPGTMGGKGVEHNLVAACASCNTKKKNQVWIPRNFEVLHEINPIWGKKILKLSLVDFREREEGFPELFKINISPSIAHAFHKKHGRNWGKEVRKIDAERSEY